MTENAQIADAWTDPDPQSSWTLDRTCNVVLGTVQRPEADYPCDEPFPCQRFVDGQPSIAFRPGRMELLSLHNVRGRELVGQRNTVGQELCRRHYGYWTRVGNRLAPVVFSLPNESTHDDEIYASVGYVTGRKTDRDEDDLLSLCPTNRLCAVACLQLPEHIEAVFDSNLLVCGTPI